MHYPARKARCFTLVLLSLLSTLLFSGSAQERHYLYGGGSYASAEEVTLSAYLGDQPQANLTLHRVGNPHRIVDQGGPADFRDTKELELSEVHQVTVSKLADEYSTDINLGVLPLGVYFAQLGSGPEAAATLLLVTDLALVVKADAGTILAYTADLVSGEPRDAEVWLLETEGVLAADHADELGLTRFDTDQTEEQNRSAAARSGDSWAFSGVWWPSWAQERTKTYIVTDRPLYRPGQLVEFKLTSRSGGSLAPLSSTDIDVTITAADSSEVLKETLTTDDFGSAHGSLLLSAAAPLGYYSIEGRIAGEQFWSSFEVLEYEKPEYEVSVSSSKDILIQGGNAEFEVDAQYLFGGAVAGGKVTYAVLREPYYRYAYRSAFEFYRDAPYYGGDLIERGEAVLDADGKARISVELPSTSFDYQLTLQAGVSDESDHEVSASSSVTVFRADLVLGASSNRYSHQVGDEVTLTVQAEDLAGSPVASDFTITTERYYWVEGAGRQVEPGVTLHGSTDASGTGQVTLSFPEQGSWGVSVSARDGAGRLTSSDASLWISGSTPWYWDYQDITITPDQDEYQPGDTARFVIESPVTDGVALITREGQALTDVELVSFQGSVFTHELSVSEQDLPNSFLGVIIVGNDTIYSATAEFRVPPSERFLNIEITADSDTFEPGSSGQFTLRVSDSSGAGVPAQVTLGLVDEAIYLIRSDQSDIRGYFYALRSNAVGTELSSFMYFGAAQPLEGRAALDSAVFGQSKAQALADARLREDFRDTILWLPSLETNADGFASVTVDFPDNLTRWRLTARAISGTNQMGQNTHSVTTTLPVIARLVTPQYLVRGDETRLRVIGQSNLEQPVEAELSVTTSGLNLLDPGVRNLNLPAGARITADYRATASETGRASVTGQVLSSAFSDAMRLSIPVIPHGIRQELTHASRGADTWRFTLPSGTDLTTLEGTLLLTPSLAAAVTPALDWLAGYPYGGTEQTMSRFLPSVLAVRAGRADSLPENVAADLDTFVQLGLNNIYDFQHPDGGWGFWQFGVSNPFISAYVTRGLLEARDAGYPVQDWVLERVLDYLAGASLKDTFQVHDALDVALRRTLTADAKAYAHYALARAGRSIDELSSFAGGSEMSNYGLTFSVLAFNAADREVEARFHLDQLIARVTEHEAVAYWETRAPRYTWSDDPVEVTARGLQALVQLEPDSPLISKLVNWLLLERRGARWISTKDTAAVVEAALALEAARPAVTGSEAVSVRFNGSDLGEFMVAADAQSVEVPLTGFLPGSNTLEVLTPEGNTLHAGSSVSFIAEEEFTRPADSGIEVTRRYELLTPAVNEEQQRVLYSRAPATSVDVGDYLLVSVTLSSAEDLRFVLVNEPLPAGFSVIEDDHAFRVAGVFPRYGHGYYGWNQWYDGRQVRDQRIDYYFARISEPVTFTYILRAENPGSFTALPSNAWLMYAPDLHGTSARDVLEVSEPAARE